MTYQYYQAPSKLPEDLAESIFLAGSIEMGKAELWQFKAAEALIAAEWNVLDPRRDDWDSTWTQSIDNPQFSEQVNWELDALEKASYVLMYFQPGTLSPISLMEFGLHSQRLSHRMIVVCPEGFWRKGNVDIVCNRHGNKQFNSLDDAINWFK